jgi:hypothetical protein
MATSAAAAMAGCYRTGDVGATTNDGDAANSDDFLLPMVGVAAVGRGTGDPSFSARVEASGAAVLPAGRGCCKLASTSPALLEAGVGGATQIPF